MGDNTCILNIYVLVSCFHRLNLVFWHFNNAQRTSTLLGTRAHTTQLDSTGACKRDPSPCVPVLKDPTKTDTFDKSSATILFLIREARKSIKQRQDKIDKVPVINNYFLCYLSLSSYRVYIKNKIALSCVWRNKSERQQAKMQKCRRLEAGIRKDIELIYKLNIYR